jgi:hypothetical protein
LVFIPFGIGAKMEITSAAVRLRGMFARVDIRRPLLCARLGIRSDRHRFWISRRGVVIYEHDEQSKTQIK